MAKTITWALEGREPDVSPHETTSLFYAEDFIRYFRYHTPFSIKYCIEGEIPYVVGNEKISVKPGSFFIVNNGTELECLPVSAGTKSLIVFFTEEFISGIASASKTLPLDEYPEDPACLEFFEHTYRCPSPLSTQIQTLARQMTAGAPGDPGALPELFFSLAENLLSFQGLTRRRINRLDARQASTRKELYRRLLAGREFMRDQWDAPLTLGEVARHACLSPYHFHRSFQEAFGEAPMRWFRQLKMEKARELLSNESMMVSDMALVCGFSDVFSFSKAFKRAWGVPPSAFTQESNKYIKVS